MHHIGTNCSLLCILFQITSQNIFTHPGIEGFNMIEFEIIYDILWCIYRPKETYDLAL